MSRALGMQLTGKGMDSLSDNVPNEGKLALSINLSQGDLALFTISTDREASTLVRVQGPTSLPFTCEVFCATAERLYCE